MLQTDITVQVDAALDSTVDLGSTSARFGFGLAVRLADGAESGQAEHVYADADAVAGGATHTIDLSPLDGGQPAGSLSAVKVLAVRCLSGEITVGGTWAGATALLADATDEIRLPAGALLLAAAPSGGGWAVTDGTGDTITLEAGAAQARFEVLIVGVSS